MKILIISSSFYPLVNAPRAFRTAELAKEFSRQGHKVDVILPANSYDFSIMIQIYPLLRFFPVSLEWKNIELSKKSKCSLFIERLLNSILGILIEYPAIEWYIKMPQILKNRANYDLLISIAFPHPIHWGVARVLKKNQHITKRWIADCGDPYMLCKTVKYPKLFYFKYFEKSFCKKADYITIPIESGKEGYYPEFRNKIKIIPQGFNFDEIELLPYIQQEKIRFCYAGGFIKDFREPYQLLEILCQQDINFEFYVFTQHKEILEPYKDKLANKLVITDYIPRLELIKFMSTMDFLINIENGTNIQIPSKLIDYALSQRPILSLESQDIDKKKLDQFLNRNYSLQYPINIKDYDIKNIILKFIQLTE
jgi:hypothetical protein